MTEPAHRFARAVTAAVVYAWYESVDVRRYDADLSGRPVIVVANHSAGLADPILIMYGMQRRPRFLAKAPLWSNAVVGKALDMLGVLPISRASEGSTEGNEGTFAACNEALRRGEVVAMFPEGKINDDASIAEVRTGAARIALGARASGAERIAIVPVGLHYEDRKGLRGRIYARVGHVIDLDAEIGRYADPGEPQDDSNREAVRRLTADIADALRDVAPDYISEDEWIVLGAAAEVAIRAGMYDPSEPVSFGDREELARRLKMAPQDERDAVLDTAGTYANLLAANRLRDLTVATHSKIGGALPDHTVRSFLATIALAPTALAGLVVNAGPMTAMSALRRGLKADVVTTATARMVAAPIVYPAAWAAWAVVLRRRGVPFGGTIALASGALGGWALVLASERIEVVRDGLSGWIRMGEEGPGHEVREARKALLDAVAAATN